MPGVAAMGPAGDDALLSVSVERADGEARALVRVAGEIDVMTAGQLAEALEKAIADGVTDVHLDLDAVPFVDSTGLTALLTARAQLDGRGTVVVVAASAAVRRTFEIAGLEDAFGPA